MCATDASWSLCDGDRKVLGSVGGVPNRLLPVYSACIVNIVATACLVCLGVERYTQHRDKKLGEFMEKLNRRAFMGGTIGVGVSIATCVRAQPDPYDTLIGGQYANTIKFVEQAGGQYFGPNFQLSPTPSEWRLAVGRYIGRVGGAPVDWHGYWIFKPHANQCWQAVNGGGSRLAFWNQDGRAAGQPEDFELFNFIAVNKAERTVKIQGIHGRFIGLVGNTFNCSENGPHAAIFTVQFT
jgi:hypothetical protein